MEGLGGRLTRALAALALIAAVNAAASLVEDVPFITTPDHVTLAMLRLAGVGPRDFVIDLGSGDGRIVITAARHFGARGLGVEIVPDLVATSRANAERAGVQSRAQFLEQDLFKTDVSQATVVTLYLLPQVNIQLRPKLLGLRPGTRIVSHDWDMGGWEPDRSIRIDVPDKKVGLEKSSRLHLWIVPAQLDGEWCGEHGTALSIRQEFQYLRGAFAGAASGLAFRAKIEGARVRALPGSGDRLTMKFEDGRLFVASAGGAFIRLQGARFQRRQGQTCG